MKNTLRYILIVLFLVSIIGCNKQNEEFKFFACEFELLETDNPFNYGKWIDNKDDALNIKLNIYHSDIKKRESLNKRNLDSLYKQTAQYLFIIGGGGIWVPVENCSAEIKNDTIEIKYGIISNSAPIGEAASSLICMEIDKKKYPNYKKMKVIFSRK